MIASLRGTVLDIQLDHVVLECAGVGYKVLATPNTCLLYTSDAADE